MRLPKMAGMKLPKSRWIRWKGVVAVSLFVVLVGLYSVLFFDEQLKSTIERVASGFNNAEVNITSLETHWFSRRMDIGGIQIANHTNPMRNLVEFDKVSITLDFTPLARKKVVIDNIKVTGVRYGTPRRTSGFLDPGDASHSTAPSLIDRVASGLYAGVRSELNENPLKFIGQLSTGLNLKGKLDPVRKSYVSEKAVVESWTKLNLLSQDWERAMWELPTKEYLADAHKRIENAYNSRNSTDRATALAAALAVRDDLQKLEQAASKKLASIENQAEFLKGNIANLDPLVRQDVQSARKVLGLPRTDFDDLTPQVFGPRILGYLERISYWVDLSRRRMPKGTVSGPVTWVAQPRARGQSIHFGKLAGNPTFLIKVLEIESNPDAGSGAGKVSGHFTGITTDPTIFGHPTQGELTADFPAAGIRNLTMKLNIDHTKNLSTENLALKVESLPLEDWVFANTGDLALKVKHGVASVDLKVAFNEESLTGNWKLSLRDVDYDVVSIYKQAEEMLRGILNPIYAFDLDGKVSGDFDKLQFTASSAMGKRLAEGLKQEYRHQLAAIDDNLVKSILDQIEPRKMEFTYRYGEIRQKFIVPMSEKVNRIRALQSLAAQTVARLESSPKARRGLASPQK